MSSALPSVRQASPSTKNLRSISSGMSLFLLPLPADRLENLPLQFQGIDGALGLEEHLSFGPKQHRVRQGAAPVFVKSLNQRVFIRAAKKHILVGSLMFGQKFQ